MTATLRIPHTLQNLTEGQPSIETHATTVQEVLDGLVAQYPAVGRHLFDAAGEVHGFVIITVDEHDVRSTGGLGTPVADGSTVSIVPAVAGG